MMGPLKVEKVWLPIHYTVEDFSGCLWDGRLVIPPAPGDILAHNGVVYTVDERIWATAEETLGEESNGYYHEFLSGDLIHLTLRVSKREPVSR